MDQEQAEWAYVCAVDDMELENECYDDEH